MRLHFLATTLVSCAAAFSVTPQQNVKETRLFSFQSYADSLVNGAATPSTPSPPATMLQAMSTDPNSPMVMYCDAAWAAASVEVEQKIKETGAFDMTQIKQIIQQKVDVAQFVEQMFPGAMASEKVLERVTRVTEARGYTPENTLFGQSICPDEVNHEEGDIPNIFAEYMGEVFHLSGLGGIPFTGKTGFGAYSAHVPDDGHCFVLMAPHVGVTNSKTVGAYDREGQHHAGSCCGAAVGALAHCLAGNPIPSFEEECDYQMSYIISEVFKRQHQINDVDENAKNVKLASEMHTIAKNVLDKIVNVNFGGAHSTLVILTGIQINMPSPFEDYFQPQSFYVIKKDGSVENWFNEAFSS